VHGRGFWKLNTSILDDPNVQADIVIQWETMLQLAGQEERDVWWWDAVKARFKRTLMAHSTFAAANRREARDILEKKT